MHKCPGCQRGLFNRRLKHCDFCGAVIPEALRFTAAEIAALDRKEAEREARAKERARAEKDRPEHDGGDDGGGDMNISTDN